MPDSKANEFLFYALSPALFSLGESEEARPVEILRTGTFTDRSGREVEITETDLDSFVANFLAFAAGQDVPIDIDHERSQAGGWVKTLERQGSKLIAFIDWNSLGTQLVGDKIYRYMSATIDLAGKVIKSVSLVNFPAVKGLKPVELSEGVYSFQEEKVMDEIRRMMQEILKALPPSVRTSIAGRWVKEQAELADGLPGSVTIGQYLSATIHKVFTNCADSLALSGFLSSDERKQLSAAIGSALEAMETGIGEAGSRLIPSHNYYPEHYFSQVQEVNDVDEKEKEALKAQLREQIQAEERQKAEVELAQRRQVEVELREQIRQEVEAELSEKMKTRQSLVEFATQLCSGEAGLSVKPEEVVQTLEGLPAEKLELVKKLLSAKVVDFSEHGSSRDGKGGENSKKKLPDRARRDVLSGQLTVAELIQSQAIVGKPEDYDLSDFTAQQIGL